MLPGFAFWAGAVRFWGSTGVIIGAAVMGALPAALGDQFRGAGDLQRGVVPIRSG